ncbi:MAG: hypothetical protein UU73_C0003G0054 [Candidatus Daviesbacteria bacterium GW2011_GWA1_41_61]|uniref:Uncharacterized protein n=1 Tax=Candidatus Daviesbacteria bacterium GW2011_GWA2_40_9 TaxID=1618424 RepID=A0A0G0U2C7_9BACT|nr:MAG: hypothetical protein UU26_C0005G0002 [Candidatus Daviesbacteria bacterium GW2011_GWC1_40_9]KKR83249.1 MAG: hypothetical protein UU29_C0007G0119 [Candidatus Daviesbacteria bacterium GW2011_GWA2_40_9]KKR93594.1 MAG: hypothetical protein UU44_C0002G0255 [Candidatus Daviesbacteria bacterium GW2011_GWB1_41_15]KKS14855.1 MAG: hypothetical protein UU73_C0003G0054 [Candidatus Daviesbacteria bacterium GW2011_GWA1_41_61]
MDKQKGIAGILIILLILIAIGVGVYLVQQKTNFLPMAFFSKQEAPVRSISTPKLDKRVVKVTPVPTIEVINNKEDLTRTLKEIDELSTDVIDSQLSSSDLSTAGI